MEANNEDALKAKEIAEKRFLEKDFSGAKNYALKAKTLNPGLEGISQMVATFEVYVASELKLNGQVDYYSILGLKPYADKAAVKKQYKKMAVLLHPDKNKCVGAEGAFRLVSEAWTLLSDSAKRGSYDLQRSKQSASLFNQTNLSSVQAAVVTGYNNSSTSHSRLDTFWTVCTSCKVQYEYLRKYVNKRLSCKNCRCVFVAVETGTAPTTGAFPYSPMSYVPGNGYPSNGYEGVTYVPSNTTLFKGNGVSGYHSGHVYEYASNVSFQWSSYPGTASGVLSHNGSSSITPDAIYQAHGNSNNAGMKDKSRANGKRVMKNVVANINSNLYPVCEETQGHKVCMPDKKRKFSVGASFQTGDAENVPQSGPETKLENGYTSNAHDQKLPPPTEVAGRRYSIAPAFDARKLLIDKARTEIQKRLEKMKLAAEVAAGVKKANALAIAKEDVPAMVVKEANNSSVSVVSSSQLHLSRSNSLSITVPDSDFHDFDKDRSEECFKPKQIWALYDEEDGMPRLYCLVREVISVRPFKIHITYLISRTDSEFGTVNWLGCGFTKSCGNFRARNSDIVEQVNVFSHVLSREKAGRGGCVRVYPRSGDIWAIYRNWSSEWDRSTPVEVRHQYEMVEVVDDYSEELGVCVSPLVKLSGFKTVYRANADKAAIRWIPRREMLRFSHQVPALLLKEEEIKLPEKCWDLDPAATPDEWLHAVIETKA